MPEFHQSFVALISSLIKHQLQKTLGGDALAILTEAMVDMAGDTFEEKLGFTFSDREMESKILKAFEKADQDFLVKCNDQTLKDAIREQNLSIYQNLREKGVELTKTLDPESLQQAIFNQISQDWRGLLPNTQIKLMVEIYMECLEQSIASQTGNILEIVYVKVAKTEKTSRQILDLVQSFNRKLDVIQSQLETKNQQETSWIAAEAAEQTRITIERHTKLFVGREKEISRINEILEQQLGGNILVTAPAGFGKTTFISNWIQKQELEGFFVIRHFFTHKYNSTLEAYKNILRQLYDYFQPDVQDFPESETSLRNKVIWLISKYPKRPEKHLVIVVDAIDEAENLFSPLGIYAWPNDVHFIVTGRSSSAELPGYLAEWGEVSIQISLDLLSKDDLVDWLNRANPAFANSIVKQENVINEIYEKTQGFPLYISFLVDELSRSLESAQIVEDILATIPRGFKAYVLQQIEFFDKFDLKPQAWKLLSLLSITKIPISKDELKSNALLGLSDRELRQIRQTWQLSRWFNIVEIDGETFLSFAHPLLADTFSELLSDEAKTAKEIIFDYCTNWRTHQGRYALETYPSYLIDMNRLDDLYTLLLKNPEWKQVKLRKFRNNSSYNDDLLLAINTIGNYPRTDELVTLFSLYAAQQVITSVSAQYTENDLEILTKLGEQNNAISFAKQRLTQKDRFAGLLEIFKALNKNDEKSIQRLFDELIKLTSSNANVFDRALQLLDIAISAYKHDSLLSEIAFNHVFGLSEEVDAESKIYIYLRICDGLISCEKFSDGYQWFTKAVGLSFDAETRKIDQLRYVAGIAAKIPDENPVFDQFHQLILDNYFANINDQERFTYSNSLALAYANENHIEQALTIAQSQLTINEKIEVLFKLLSHSSEAQIKNIVEKVPLDFRDEIRQTKDDNLLPKIGFILVCNDEVETIENILSATSAPITQEVRKSIAKAATKVGNLNLLKQMVSYIENENDIDSLYYAYFTSDNANIIELDVQVITDSEKQSTARKKQIVALAKSGKVQDALIRAKEEPDRDDIADILVDICKLDTKDILLNAIFDEVSSMKSTDKRVGAFRSFALNAIKYSNNSYAQKAFDEIQLLSESIKSTPSWVIAQALLTGLVADKAQSEPTTEFENALNIAREIADKNDRSSALNVLALTAARRGWGETALNAAQEIPVYYHRIACLKELTHIFATAEENENFEKAFELIDIISLKDDILRRISLANGYANKFDSAVEATERMSLDINRVRTWSDLLVLINEHGALDKFESVLNRLMDDYYSHSFQFPQNENFPQTPLFAAFVRIAGVDTALEALGSLTDSLNRQEYFRTLCYAYLEEGKLQKAVASLEQLLEVDAQTKSTDFTTFALKTIADSGNPELALSAANKISAEKYVPSLIHAQIGMIFIKQGQEKMGKEILAKVTENDNPSVIMHRIAAGDYSALKGLNINQPDEFLAFCLNCLPEIERQKAGLGHEILSSVLSQLGEINKAWDQSCKWFARFTSSQIEGKEFNLNRAPEIMRRNKYKSDTQSLHRINDKRMAAVFYCIKGLEEKEETLAKAAFEHAASLTEHPVFTYHRALSCCTLKQWQEAKDLLLKVDKYWPENRFINDFLGWALTELNDIKSAIECYTTILKKEPENQAFLLNRAKLFYVMDELQPALEDLRIITPDQNSTETLDRQVRIHITMGDTRQARECIERAMNFGSDDWTWLFLYWRSLINLLDKNYKLALSDLENASPKEETPGDIGIRLFFRSIINDFLGNKNEAEIDLSAARKAIEGDTTSQLSLLVRMLDYGKMNDLQQSKAIGEKLLSETDCYQVAGKRLYLRYFTYLFPENPIWQDLAIWYSDQMKISFGAL